MRVGPESRSGAPFARQGRGPRGRRATGTKR
ncbi:hypothetical protein BURMUCF1_0822, partial [Burkholderia multivorans ATCC BAA-247]